jgi:hypothetical protein
MSVQSNVTRTAPIGAVGIALALVLASAPAAHAGNRQDIGDHGDVVVAECADGGNVTGPLEGSVSFHERLAKDGSLMALSLSMEYKMTWTLSTTGQSVYPHGTRHLVFDFADGTVTESGNYRTLTVAGEGRVLKYAGRSVLDLESGEWWKKGPDVADIGDPSFDNDLVCSLFGIDGA